MSETEIPEFSLYSCLEWVERNRGGSGKGSLCLQTSCRPWEAPKSLDNHGAELQCWGVKFWPFFFLSVHPNFFFV